MIVTEKKSFQELLSKLEAYKKIVVFGCGDCATVCKTGGKEEVEELVRILEKKGKKIVYHSVIDTSCDERLVKLELKKIKAKEK